ncbi:MAG: sigma-70 family RNA polymerase sigma factor [Bacteroidota bacterium]
MIPDKIIEKCKKGDRPSQGMLYNTCAPYVFTVVKSYVKDEDYVKDIMQEAFAAIFKSIDSYDSKKGSFKPWIAQITIRKCINHLKYFEKFRICSDLEVVDTFSDEDFSHLDELSVNDISVLLHEMPSGYKTIFMLSVIDEYPHTEIAKLLDISPETSRSQLHRAMKWIKKNIFKSSNHCRYEAL